MCSVLILNERAKRNFCRSFIKGERPIHYEDNLGQPAPWFRQRQTEQAQTVRLLRRKRYLNRNPSLSHFSRSFLRLSIWLASVDQLTNAVGQRIVTLGSALRPPCRPSPTGKRIARTEFCWRHLASRNNCAIFQRRYQTVHSVQLPSAPIKRQIENALYISRLESLGNACQFTRRTFERPPNPLSEWPQLRQTVRGIADWRWWNRVAGSKEHKARTENTSSPWQSRFFRVLRNSAYGIWDVVRETMLAKFLPFLSYYFLNN